MQATIDSPSQTLTELDCIRRALAETSDLRRIKGLRHQAEEVREYAKSAALGLEVQNQAAEVRLLAERRAGQVLRDMPLRGGDRKSDRRNATRLDDLGISQQESCRWQREASLPEEDFQEYVRLTVEAGKELTSSDLLRLARVYTRETSARENLFRRMMGGLRKLVQEGSPFRCIHVIPPWPDVRTSRASISRLALGLLDLPVQSVAAEKAHLHLWTPPEMLEDGLRLLRAWGFQYRTSLVRTKLPADSVGFWRQAHEVLLLGVRGDLQFPDRSLLSWLDPRTDSAAELLCEIRSQVERASPGPYLELFGGKATRVWTVLTP